MLFSPAFPELIQPQNIFYFLKTVFWIAILESTKCYIVVHAQFIIYTGEMFGWQQTSQEFWGSCPQTKNVKSGDTKRVTESDKEQEEMSVNTGKKERGTRHGLSKPQWHLPLAILYPFKATRISVTRTQLTTV